MPALGTYTSSYPPAEDVVRSAQALEAAGFDSVWSGDQPELAQRIPRRDDGWHTTDTTA